MHGGILRFAQSKRTLSADFQPVGFGYSWTDPAGTKTHRLEACATRALITLKPGELRRLDSLVLDQYLKLVP